MRLKNLLLLLTTGEVKNIVWYEELTANDNELVFQVDEHLTNKNLFGTNASTTYHPSSAYSVYINDSLTDQTFDNITCLRGDVVKIVANGVDSFPVLYEKYGLPFSCIAPLPPMTSKYGSTSFDLSNIFMYWRGKVPENLFKNNEGIYRLSDLFEHSHIVEIPPLLLEPLIHLSSVRNTFWGTNITSIPENLFANNTELNDIHGCFCGTEITELPENLIKNNPRISNCTWAFMSTKITSIPSMFFGAGVRDVTACFDDCVKLTNIPSDLFVNCLNLKTVGNSYSGDGDSRVYSGVFSDCTSLTSVPDGLFDNNILVTEFKGCFKGCTALTSVPENLFVNNTEVTSFHSTFYGCTNLSGRFKIGSSKVTDASRFCERAGAITVVVPAGSTTETTFRNYAATVTNLTVETY